MKEKIRQYSAKEMREFPANNRQLSPQDCYPLMELLYFAYRDFTAQPDVFLKAHGFGRAHHRVLHFVRRNPGLTVAELLEILQVTKQSLGRVLKNLILKDLVYQVQDIDDKRKRLLYVTEEGDKLASHLASLQIQSIGQAVAQLSDEQAETIQQFLLNAVQLEHRPFVKAIISKSHRKEVSTGGN